MSSSWHNDYWRSDHVHISVSHTHGNFEYKTITSQVEIVDLHGNRSIISKQGDGTVSITKVKPGSGIERLRDKYLQRMQEAMEAMDPVERRRLLEGRWTDTEETRQRLDRAMEQMMLYGETLIGDERELAKAQLPVPKVASPIERQKAIEAANDIASKRVPDLPRQEQPGMAIDFQIGGRQNGKTHQQDLARVVWAQDLADPNTVSRMQRYLAGDQGPQGKGQYRRV